MKIQVSELIVRYLEKLGIKYIFGMPGAHILPVYDSLYDSNIKSILAKHEQGAAFMAGGYAKASGEISACIATAGPGATNLITGVANAYADKQPLVVITGETPTNIFGKGGLQESSGEGGSIDQGELFKSVTRYSKVIERTDYLAQVLNQASKVLFSSAPGPVLLSIPYNVQKELVDDDILDLVITSKRQQHIKEESPLIDSLASKMIHTSRPAIIAGYGCIRSNAQELVSQLSKSMNVPVATSLKAKGVIGEDSPLSLGSLGVTSNDHAYRYLTETADMLIFLGAGFNERTSYLWDSKLLNKKVIVQIDNDPGQLEKVFQADIAIAGDLKDVLASLLDKLTEQEASPKELKDMMSYRDAQTANPEKSQATVSEAKFALAKKFFAELASRFPKDTYFFDDNIIFAQNFLNVSSENHYYPNSGVSSLGHAIPAAIGARFFSNRPTFAILGDGGFQMCCMEIMTAVNYDLPINILLFNNATMGLIRKNQSQQYDKRYINCDFINPDYKQLAKSFGINHVLIKDEADTERMFAENDLEGESNLIEILIDKDTFPNYHSRR